ncbi:hypothetical protein BZL30_6972 [Mycobacterium kansasii]|uniref:Uncharacterized protein n=1 Tax=Mycobacterium kansasii TaxID=1768 RepID=A0A1V3WS12_MYCKA|nr:hypothetical protein BZL30_6972 [Mycobacterium kansasii]
MVATAPPASAIAPPVVDATVDPPSGTPGPCRRWSNAVPAPFRASGGYRRQRPGT